MYADIEGWGSTVEASPKPYRHIPVQIVPPGNIESVSRKGSLSWDQFRLWYFKTGDDTETLKKVERVIQSKFVDGRPPHLQPNARNLRYVPGSDQSRIFVTSHSDFSRLEDREVQRILRERIILVHDNPLGYDYKWDLKSFARLYDVEKKTTIHGEM